MKILENLEEWFHWLPPGPWSDPPDTAVVLPIPSNKTHEPAGLMVAGVSARSKFDQLYKDFIELVRTQVATAIANARAYEEERRRVQALAEIDRAKIAFFSNVSHEFRTPLTLMLGPLEDILAQDNISQADRERPDLTHRNALRQLKLVNTLLDFSRIEAGRMEASYEPMDLAAYTMDLANMGAGGRARRRPGRPDARRVGGAPCHGRPGRLAASLRTMNPSPPEDDMTVWLATNTRSRKVHEMRRDPRVALYYSDHQNAIGYVQITGRAVLVEDMQEILKRKRAYWDQAPGLQNLVLIKVVPERLDVLNYEAGLPVDPQTWRTPSIELGGGQILK